MGNKLFLLGVIAFANSAIPIAQAADEVLNYVLEYNGETLNSRTDYTYDSNGMMTEKLTRQPNSEGGLENYAKSNYGYDDQGRCNMVENYLWDDNTLTWYGLLSDDEAKRVTTFNNDGRPSEILYYQWNSGWGDQNEWKYRGTFTYEGNTGTESRYEQINGIPKGDPSYIIDYTYDDQLRTVEKIKNMYSFDFESYDYKRTPTDRWVYEYDSHDNPTLEEQYMYIGGGDDWEDPWGDYSTRNVQEETSGDWALLYRYKYEYTYDERGNIASKKHYQWSDIDGGFTLVYEFTYEYHYGSNDALELPYSNDFNTANSLDAFTTDDGNSDGNSWTLGDGMVSCTSTLASEAPEILYLPALRFSTENEVEISFKAKAGSADKPAKLQMILCNNDDQHTPLGTIGQIWEINSTEYTDLIGRIVPDKSDAFVIGICFDNASVDATVSIDDLEVKNGRSTDTPMAPYSVTATPARDGSLQVQLVWYPYPYTIGEEYINSVDNMEVYRDGVEEPLYSTGAIGTSLGQRFTDKSIPEAGEYTYRIYAYKNGLRSDAAVVTVVVGNAVPQPITGFKAVENEDHSITLSWDAPAAADGNVKYYILRNNEVELATEFEGTSFTDDQIDTSLGQAYCFYMITPYNEAGYGDATYSELLFVGESNASPFKESWAGGTGTHQWMNEIVSGYDAAWGNGASMGTITPQDEDGGIAAFMSTQLAEGNVVRFTSEKIDLSTTSEPEISFYMYHLGGEISGDAIVIEASKDNGEYEIVSDPISVSGYETEGWTQHIVSLARFAGEKNVRVSFRGISGVTHNIAIDNVIVGEKGCSGVDNLLDNSMATIHAVNGEIIVSAAVESEIKAFTINGIQIYAATATNANIPVADGIYIVTVNGKATKVVVK